MAGIRLEWAQFGDFDSFDVLRSNSPMDVNSLPSPIATNLPTMYHVDTTVVDDATYYYRVVAWRDGVSKVSEEIQLKASSGDPHWDKVVSLLHFDDEANPWNDATGKIWEPVGMVELALGKWGNSAVSFAGQSNYLRSPNTDGVFNLPGQFTFECWFQHTNTGGPYRNIFLGGSSGFPGGFAVTVGNKSSITVAEMYGQNVLTVPFTIGDAWYFLAVTRDIENIVRLFIDGVLIAQTVSTSPFSFSPSGHAHILNHPEGDGSAGRIDELRITKGIARYTENFIPPDAPFPSY